MYVFLKIIFPAFIVFLPDLYPKKWRQTYEYYLTILFPYINIFTNSKLNFITKTVKELY
jgi:hypothetical protein